jgi:hypothetical protein
MYLLGLLIYAHAWYSTQCCGSKDCKPVPCDAIQWRGEYVWYGPDRVRPAAIQSSPDSQCHVCVNTSRFIPDRMLCVFMPGMT